MCTHPYLEFWSIEIPCMAKIYGRMNSLKFELRIRRQGSRASKCWKFRNLIFEWKRRNKNCCNTSDLNTIPTRSGSTSGANWFLKSIFRPDWDLIEKFFINFFHRDVLESLFLDSAAFNKNFHEKLKFSSFSLHFGEDSRRLLTKV